MYTQEKSVVKLFHIWKENN